MTASPIAWDEVAGKLRPYISRRVPASDVEDVLQDVLMRVHRGLGSLRDDDRFAGWMFRIAGNAIAERGRDRIRHPVPASANPVDVAQEPSEDRVAAQALAACLTLFVARLESPYREAITAVELEGQTTREAAMRVGISVSGMKSRVQRGRAQLRTMLDACCEIAVDARGGVTDMQPRSACCSPAKI